MSASVDSYLRRPLRNGQGHDGSEDQSQRETPLELTVDEILEFGVGDFGWSQFFHFFLLGLSFTVEGLQTLVVMFSDRNPEWQCKDAFDSGMSSSHLEAWAVECTSAANICDLSPRQWEWVGGPGGSTVSTFGLICGDAYKVGLAQSLFFVGYLASAGLFGSLSDGPLGRKGALMLSCVSGATFGFLSAISPNYWSYAILRAATGFGCGGIGLIGFVLGTEPIGQSRRGAVGVLSSSLFAGGIMLLPLIALFFPSWRQLYLVTTIPTLLFLVFIIPTSKESPRWLLVHGKSKEALDVLRRFAKGNGRSLPVENLVLVAEHPLEVDEVEAEVASLAAEAPPHGLRKQASLMRAFSNASVSIVNADVESEATGGLTDIFRFSTTRHRLLCMAAIWFTCGIVYYGLNLNAVNMGTNLYLSTFVSGLVEIPAYLAASLLMQTIGRRSLVFSGLLLSSVCSLLVGTIPTGLASPGPSLHVDSGVLASVASSNTLTVMRRSAIGLLGAVNIDRATVRLWLSLLGKFGISASYTGVYVYTAELFPTVVRNAALGITTQVAQVGGILAPFIVVLGRSASFVPFFVFGLVSMVAAALSQLLPETLNQPLWETIEGIHRNSTVEGVLHAEVHKEAIEEARKKRAEAFAALVEAHNFETPSKK